MDGETQIPADSGPYWADTYEEVAPHVFRRRDTDGVVLSAEKTWAHLRENLRRLRTPALAEAA